ncbi:MULTISPECIES: lasso peptide biosynthesis PqqD family chaperone [Streptomyces]|uniref:lasso peptide biosynthesis PqqD family chaperone n=1 Tax=Streptomyces TaxID=1883 RepID=UPI0016459ECE|nr:lasso peptide biosynthesis PqqD family chaperone [Streptomyces salinarius]
MLLNLPPDVATVDTEDGMVLLNERTGRYWQLNVNGAQTLRRLLDGWTVEEIASDMAARHQIAPGQARGDITRVIEQLQKARLLEASK